MTQSWHFAFKLQVFHLFFASISTHPFPSVQATNGSRSLFESDPSIVVVASSPAPYRSFMNHHLYLGVGGHVVCFDQQSGKEHWRTYLKSGRLTNILVEDGRVFAHVGGHLFCLDAESGEFLWQDGLVNLGYGYAILATANSTGHGSTSTSGAVASATIISDTAASG